MGYRTVNLLPGTYDRLLRYKVAGRSFDDVVLHLMDRSSPSEYHRQVLRDVGGRKGGRRGRERVEREMAKAWQRLLAQRKRGERRGR